MTQLQPVSHKDYMQLADAYDKHSRTLMAAKGEEYAIKNDFLAMENRLAGMLGESPEFVSLVMAGKHITAIGIILEKNEVTKIKLEKLDERIRDATNLLKITSAFIHAKQEDFSLHLGKGEKEKSDNISEEYAEFTIVKAQDSIKGWYVILTKAYGHCYSGSMFLHKDLTLQPRTGWDNSYKYGEAPGYYKNKDDAKIYIAAYGLNEDKFIVPAPWKIVYQVKCGWWVCLTTPLNYYLRKDNRLYHDTGGGSEEGYSYGNAPGYWPSKQAAENALREYLER